METVDDFIFLGSIISSDGDCGHKIKRNLLLRRKAMTNLTSILKSKLCWHYFVYKGQYSQIYGFSSSHTWMWDLDHKEDWVPKNWYSWFVVLEKTLESPLDSKEIKPLNPKGNQLWIFIGRTDAEVPILWPPDMKSQLTRKDLDAGKIDGRRRKGDSERQGSLGCHSPWSRRVGNELATEQQELCRVKPLLILVVMKKSATFIVGAIQGDWAGAAHVPKTWTSQSSFRGRGFKGCVREGATGCVISSCTVVILVGIRWSFKHHKPSGFGQSRVCVLIVSSFHLVEVCFL